MIQHHQPTGASPRFPEEPHASAWRLISTQGFAILFSFAVVTLASQAAAATRVELKIDELRPNRTVAWPVTTGVPFPQGGLTDSENCRLVDDRGEEQLLQVKTTAWWDAAKSSIRWLTIDFIAQPGRKYALEFGPDVRRKSFPPAITIAAGGDVVVETGPLEVEFSRRGPAALGSVRIDRNGDGNIAPEEWIARGPEDGDHVFVDEHVVQSSGASDDADRIVVVESNGPIRACIRVDGWYTGSLGERIVAYRSRYHLFAGLPLVKMIDEFRIVGSTRGKKFRDIALPLQLHLDRRGQRVSTAWKSSFDDVTLIQKTFRHYGNPECIAQQIERTFDGEQVVKQAERAGPWMQVADDFAAVTGSLRHFADQFPKEWETTDDRFSLHLWSPRVPPLDFGEAGLRDFFGPAGQKHLVDWKPAGSRTPITDFFYYAGRQTLERDGADGLGINKHHEVWYHFAPADKAAEGREYGELADAQPLCLATGEWNVGTGVFGPLAARPNNSPYEAIVDRIFDLERYAQDSFGDYGWFLFGAGPHYSYQWDPETKRHVADPRRFEFHTYQRDTQLWWNYLRSGERKFHDWCFPSEDHWIDIAVSHVPTKYSTLWRGGAQISAEPREATLHFRPGDWSIDSPLHYVRQHDTGEAWLRSAPQFWASYHRTLETTTLAYYLTGDERYNDVITFWKDYWGDLAGVRSDSAGVPEWHREQLWWQPTKPGEPAMSWAEMLRDYAPFQSGSRHQQTLLFNLSTLYEHTWDPTVAKVLREYADAFIDPAAPNGVWQCQDHRLPANADSPMLAHFWAPALWKYARATNDPRMPEVLKKYFSACLEADPYGEDVGIYSNNQIAWAWHFTKDPRHLVAAKYQLDQLSPNAEPLAKPEDLNHRIYNPYAPIMCLATVPRLIGALAEAEKAGGVVPSTPPLTPQRTLVALRRKADEPIRATLWGWDRTVQLLHQTGTPIEEKSTVTVHRSHRQPFDRVLPGYQVYRRESQTPGSASGAWVYLSPKVETGIVELTGADDVWCWAGEPISCEPRQVWKWRRPASAGELIIESAATKLLVVKSGERVLEPKLVQNTLVVPLADLPADAWVTIETSGPQTVWFRLVGVDAGAAWVTTDANPGAIPPAPSPELLASRRREPVDPRQVFVPGRFGQALLIVPGRELHIANEIAAAVEPGGGGSRRAETTPAGGSAGASPSRQTDGELLTKSRQGTLELWVRRFDDQRRALASRAPLVFAGPISVTTQKEMPLEDWFHVAIVWRPLPGDPSQSLVHVYVDGRDFAFYRSLAWEGYSKPRMFAVAAEWLKEFVAKAPPGTMFAIDDVRISDQPRYVDLSLDFGRQQTFNPTAIEPPSRPFEFDESTTLLLPLDGDLKGKTRIGTVEATLIREKPPK